MQQLDFFVDGRDALLVHAVVTSLVARDHEAATARLAVLRSEHPAHPDVPALARLTDSLRASPPSPLNHATLTSAVQPIHDVLDPAARRLLGPDAGRFLDPLWRMLAAAASLLRFDESWPRAHPSWLHLQREDWPAVCASVEAEPDWPERSLLRYRLGLARHHVGEADAAIRLWLPLCWLDPALFARYAPALPNAMLRDEWDSFERSGAFGHASDATPWFPSWLLVRHRRLADVFERADVPDDAGAVTETFRALLTLIPLERRGLTGELIAHRRALQRLSPELFACYMATIATGRPRRV